MLFRITVKNTTLQNSTQHNHTQIYYTQLKQKNKKCNTLLIDAQHNGILVAML